MGITSFVAPAKLDGLSRRTASGAGSCLGGSAVLLLALLASPSHAADNATIKAWIEMLRQTPDALQSPQYEQEKYIPIKDWHYSPPPPFSRTYLTPLLEDALKEGVVTRRKISERLAMTQADKDWCATISKPCSNQFDPAYDDWEWCLPDGTECHANYFSASMRKFFNVDDETWDWFFMFPRLEGLHTFSEVADRLEAGFSGRIMVVVSIGEITAKESE